MNDALFRLALQKDARCLLLVRSSLILWANDRAAACLGSSSAEDLKERNVRDIIDPDSLSAYERMLARAQSKGESTMGFVLNISGARQSVVLHLRMLQEADALLAIYSAADFSAFTTEEEKKMPEQTDLSFRELTERQPFGIIVYDGNKTLYINEVTRFFVQTLKINVEAFNQNLLHIYRRNKGQENSRLKTLGIKGLVIDELKVEDEMGREIEGYILQAMVLPMDLSGKEVYVFYLKNISKEYLYRLHQEWLLSSVDDLPIDVMLVKADGYIYYVNNNFLKTKKVRKEQIIGTNIKVWTKYAKRDEVLKTILASFMQRTNEDKDVAHSTEADTWWYHVKTKWWSDDGAEGFVVIVQDITSRKQLEQERRAFSKRLQIRLEEKTAKLEEQNRQLEKSRRSLIYLLEDMQDMQKALKQANEQLDRSNRDLEAFNYSVSHDLKRPLRTILHFAGFVLEDNRGKLSAESERMLQEINSQANYMFALMDDLLHFSRLGNTALNRVPIDMQALVEAVGNELLKERGSKVQLKIERLLPVTGDYILIKQVVYNLLSNAIKYSSKKEDAEIRISARQDEKGVETIIKDNGIGIPAQQAERVFDLFYRHKSAGEFSGTGVGLTIVKRIIEKHDGRVFIQAPADGNTGTEVHFILPKKN